MNQIYNKGLIKVLHDSKKPLLAVKIPGSGPSSSPDLCRAGIPFFDSAERAVDTYSLALRYGEWRRNQASSADGD
ncbi:MAG: hypothetical protein GY850_05630 [bacterium]|nr:hypothetical protein [bacterium]